MNLKDLMQWKNFVVVGKTLDESKYAYKIKKELLENGYQVEAVYSERKNLNEVEMEIDVIVLCINATLGLQFLKECQKSFKAVLIQPGAESEALLSYLQEQNIPHLEGCALLGLRLPKEV